MTTFHNCYAFTRTHERVIIDMGLPYNEALKRCEFEAAFIEEMGDKLQRYGDNWFGDGLIPRVAMHDVRFDPFRDTSIKDITWLPDSSEL